MQWRSWKKKLSYKFLLLTGRQRGSSFLSQARVFWATEAGEWGGRRAESKTEEERRGENPCGLTQKGSEEFAMRKEASRWKH